MAALTGWDLWLQLIDDLLDRYLLQQDSREDLYQELALMVAERHDAGKEVEAWLGTSWRRIRDARHRLDRTGKGGSRPADALHHVDWSVDPDTGEPKE